jgi:hypothetical protein
MNAAAAEQQFADYKKAEKKALEILREMKAVSPKKVDIELALLVAIFELHKGTLPSSTISAIIQGHIETLLPYYGGAPLTPVTKPGQASGAA